MVKINVKNHIDNNSEIKLQSMIRNLPSFCSDYFQSIEVTSSPKTRIAYAYDLGVFFKFILNSYLLPQDTNLEDISLKLLEQLKPVDIEKYLDYLSYYSSDNLKKHVNTEHGKKRKLIAVRNLYSHYYKKQMILSNPAFIVNIPKINKPEVFRLENNDICKLINEVENAENLTKTQQEYHIKTKVRDLAIITLLLRTGIRVSECVNLDINDLDFKINSIKIKRRGGYESIICFDDEVKNALSTYIQQRKLMQAVEKDNNAIFLSLQRRRISVRSVEKLVKKYGSAINLIRTITPHRLRSTYGINLYLNTNNIYFVNDVLGNKDVNTTKLNYVIENDNCQLSNDKNS